MRRGSFFHDFPATSTLLLLIIGFFCLEVIYTQKEDGGNLLESASHIDARVLTELGANRIDRLQRGELWRLVSHAFLHAGIFHILMNGLVLADLGRLCEPLLSTPRFTVAYLASAVGGGLGTAGYAVLSGGRGFSVGASGALSGLIGLLLAFSIRHRERELRQEIVRSILYIALFSILMPNIDHAAHAGGFVVGGIFGFLTPRYVTSRLASLWKVPFWLTSAATALCLGFALWSFFGALRAR
jgi:membrane associated rhomboid family serine protease